MCLLHRESPGHVFLEPCARFSASRSSCCFFSLARRFSASSFLCSWRSFSSLLKTTRQQSEFHYRIWKNVLSHTGSLLIKSQNADPRISCINSRCSSQNYLASGHFNNIESLRVRFCYILLMPPKPKLANGRISFAFAVLESLSLSLSVLKIQASHSGFGNYTKR